MRRIKELDAIRGLAAIAIVVYHIWLPSWEILGSAVDLFFVLSGYLITTIILKNAATDRSIVAFYARRFLRIAPIYYLALAALVLVNPWMPSPESLQGLPYYLTYTQKVPTYWGAPDPPFITAFRHTWTLAIEEQFYILWPALLWLLGRRRLPALSLAFVGLAIWARAAGFNRWVLATNCDGLALGGLLAGLLFEEAAAEEGNARSGRNRGLMAIGLSCCMSLVLGVLMPRLTTSHHVPEIAHSIRVVGINLFYTLVIGILAVNAGSSQLRWLRSRPLVYLGVISYGLYLYHHIIVFTWDDLARAHGWASGEWARWIKAGMCLAVAAISWRFIERPILELKDRFRYRPLEEKETITPEPEVPRIVGVSLR